MHAVLKKRYGQNFLIDRNILNKITKLIPNKKLNILEIGPGDGRLSEFILLKDPKKLTLVEIDTELMPLLKEKYKKLINIELINKDILKYDFNQKFDLIVSNLPYNISSQILVKICLLNNLPNNLILMFQKEFAIRLLDKKLNSLNSLVNCFYNVDKSFNVSKSCFRPIPKIDSKILFFKRKDKSLLKSHEIESFIEFKRNLFSYKRKSIKNSLKKFTLRNDNFDLSKRIEDLSLDLLLKILEKLISKTFNKIS